MLLVSISAGPGGPGGPWATVRLLILAQAFVVLDSGGRSASWASETTADQSGPAPEPERTQSSAGPSVEDYHTCGSGINPSRDMGTSGQDGERRHRPRQQRHKRETQEER